MVTHMESPKRLVAEPAPQGMKGSDPNQEVPDLADNSQEMTERVCDLAGREECQKELRFQREEEGETVGSDGVNKNGVYLPAGSETHEEKWGKRPPQGGLHEKQSPWSQGPSGNVEAEAPGGFVITGLELQRPKMGDSLSDRGHQEE